MSWKICLLRIWKGLSHWQKIENKRESPAMKFDWQPGIVFKRIKSCFADSHAGARVSYKAKKLLPDKRNSFL